MARVVLGLKLWCELITFEIVLLTPSRFMSFTTEHQLSMHEFMGMHMFMTIRLVM
jgi:hypothetical protein